MSGVLALTGRPDARRAAARGLVLIALASAVANVPAKLLTMRPRPPIEVVPLSRRAMRVPTSSSFPSGHSASAAAYAVGASLELPQLALPIRGLAALVAGSRVATGVHYPSDVIAGVAIGVGCAMVVARVWRPSSRRTGGTVRRSGRKRSSLRVWPRPGRPAARRPRCVGPR